VFRRLKKYIQIGLKQPREVKQETNQYKLSAYMEN